MSLETVTFEFGTVIDVHELSETSGKWSNMVYSSTIDSVINAIWGSQAEPNVMITHRIVLDASESEMFDQSDRINLIRFDLRANLPADTVALSVEENTEPKKPGTDIKDAAHYDSTQIDGFSKNDAKLKNKKVKTHLKNCAKTTVKNICDFFLYFSALKIYHC